MTARTKEVVLGEVENLSRLITDLRFCKSVVTPGRGSHPLKPDGHLFVSSPGCTQFQGSACWQLYGKPTAEFRKAAEPFCFQGLASIEIIPWQHAGKALVLAHDGAFIASPWIAFIPLSEIPDTQQLLIGDPT